MYFLFFLYNTSSLLSIYYSSLSSWGFGVLVFLHKNFFPPTQPPKALSCWPTAVELPTGNGLLESTTERSLSLDSNLEGLAASLSTARTFEACFAFGSSGRVLREFESYLPQLTWCLIAPMAIDGCM